MLRIDFLIPITATLLLLAANWFAGEDLQRPHTARDWLTLFGSIFVLIQFAIAVLRHGFIR